MRLVGNVLVLNIVVLLVTTPTKDGMNSLEHQVVSGVILYFYKNPHIIVYVIQSNILLVTFFCVIATLFNNHNYLRTGIAVMLLLLIGFKTVTPVVLLAKAAFKELSSATETDESKSEKKAENEPSSESNKEYASIYTKSGNYERDFVKIAHATTYHTNYQSSHYAEVSTPPPNFILHITI